MHKQIPQSEESGFEQLRVMMMRQSGRGFSSSKSSREILFPLVFPRKVQCWLRRELGQFITCHLPFLIINCTAINQFYLRPTRRIRNPLPLATEI